VTFSERAGVFAAAAGACGLLVIALFWGEPTQGRTAPSPQPIPSTVVAGTSSSASTHPPTRQPQSDEAGELLAVELDPPNPCKGSDAVVRVRLANEDPSVRVLVAGSLGNPAVVRTSRLGSKHIPIQVVHADGDVATFHHFVEVAECASKEDARLVVAARRLAHDTVEAVNVIRRGLQPGALRWDFGDGSVIERDGREVTHQYTNPDVPWESHVITVSGITQSGSAISARAHFAVRRPGFVDPDEVADTERALAEREAEQARLRAREGAVEEELP
jgi:hypothetical protein